MKRVLALCVFMSMAYGVCAEIPSCDVINLAFSCGGTNKEVFERVYPLITNTYPRVSSEGAELERARYCFFTNVIAMHLAVNGNLHENFEPIVDLITIVSSYDSVKTNRLSTLGIASFIGRVQGLSTNEFASELAMANGNTNVTQCYRRWRPIFSFNNRIDGFRIELVESYSDCYKACLASLPDDQKAAFTSNVVEAARFNAEEIRQLQRGIWDD